MEHVGEEAECGEHCRPAGEGGGAAHTEEDSWGQTQEHSLVSHTTRLMNPESNEFIITRIISCLIMLSKLFSNMKWKIIM